ncbi:MAG TPA: hypothetical protein VG778_02180 [Blastocatellia bacterium]|jgi:hypothetical protein|nr:hypothetical protein [Blastocatellia bacterium]
MESRQYEIECGRCGESRPELLTGDEANGIVDRTSPVYRLCERCGRTTGWIKAKARPAVTAEPAR